MTVTRSALMLVPALGIVLGIAASGAQRPAPVRRIGYLPSASTAPTPERPSAALQAFRQALADLGYVEGRDVVIEPRWAEGRQERLPALAAYLVRSNVEVIVTLGCSSRGWRRLTTFPELDEAPSTVNGMDVIGYRWAGGPR
jgi:hypothetical protein